MISWGIGYTKNNLKESNAAGSIKEKYDKRSDNVICGFAWLNDPFEKAS